MIRRFVILVGGLLLLFGLISLNLNTDWMLRIDQAVIMKTQNFHNRHLTRFFIWISYLGSKKIEYPLLGLACSYFLLRLNYKTALILFLNLVSIRWMNGIIKDFFQRLRPPVEHLTQVEGYSFPSGHAMITMAFYGFLGYLLCFYLKNTRLAWYIAAFMTLFIFMVGLSRIYLGVHYVSDVIAGFAAGGIWLMFSIFIFRKTVNEKQERRLVKQKNG